LKKYHATHTWAWGIILETFSFILFSSELLKEAFSTLRNGMLDDDVERQFVIVDCGGI
jgi:hypothetical protein